MTHFLKILSLSLALMVALVTAASGAITDLQISENEASATIELDPYSIDLTLTFEEVLGLDESSLGLSAEIVDPLDPDLLARLADGVVVPAALPILVSIEPPADGPLAFSGVATLELYTHDLSFTGDCPFRVFVSRDGGTFRDATDQMGTGSYRGRGRTGGFSEFLILADSRDSAAVVDLKFNRLWSLMDEHAAAIPDDLFGELHGLAAEAEAAWGAGDPVTARDRLEAFSDRIREADGSEIPNVWNAAETVENAAGELRSAAATLRFGLSLTI